MSPLFQLLVKPFFIYIFSSCCLFFICFFASCCLFGINFFLGSQAISSWPLQVTCSNSCKNVKRTKLRNGCFPKRGPHQSRKSEFGNGPRSKEADSRFIQEKQGGGPFPDTVKENESNRKCTIIFKKTLLLLVPLNLTFA